jgi:GT2 family glycosyltransferase
MKLTDLPTCVAMVLHHNNRALLPTVFESLLAQEGLSAICLIDNASSDDSVPFTRHHYPEVEIIQNRENLNFGTAYNRAITTRSEDVVFLANNDITVRSGSIRNALQFLASNRDVASVSFEGLDPNRFDPFPVECGPLVRFGKELSPARYFVGSDDPPSESACYLWGAAVCIRRGLFARVRFDEAMDWGFEDIDLGWAIARQTGMRNVFLPSATIFHMESKTVRERFRQKQIWQMLTRNAILSFAKNATSPELLRAAPYIAMNLFRCRRRAALILEVAVRLGRRLRL